LLRARQKAAKVRTGAPAHPEQAALVQRAIAQEKVLIKNIQQRTPLVETYIQDTRPDVKLYEVPTRPVHAQPRGLRQGFFDKTYEPKEEGKHGFFKGSIFAP
jgi:hypothetical protein